MIRERADRRRAFFLPITTVLLVIGLLLFSLNAIQTRAYRSQIVLRAPESLFTYWNSPLTGLHFSKINLAVMNQSDLVVKNLDGQIIPKLWNLMMGCASGTDLRLQGLEVTFQDGPELVLGLRALFNTLAFNKNKLHQYICQSTRIEAENGTLRLSDWGKRPVLIKAVSVKKTDSPQIQLEGLLLDRHRFGAFLTYKPLEDIVVFSSDFGQQSRFDGQVDSFSDTQKSFLKGQVHWPAGTMTLGGEQLKAFSMIGQVSFSADLSGELPDLVTNLFASETLILDGAVDIREGILKPVNLFADVLREVGQIPALTQLGQLIDQKALPKAFYVDETPFNMMRFLIRKEGRVIGISRVVIKHSLYLAAGEGWIHPESGDLSFTGSLVLSEELSSSLINNVPGLKILLSENGRLSFPFKMAGSLKAPRVRADVKQITETMIDVYRKELVRRGNSRIEVSQ